MQLEGLAGNQGQAEQLRLAGASDLVCLDRFQASGLSTPTPCSSSYSLPPPPSSRP